MSENESLSAVIAAYLEAVDRLTAKLVRLTRDNLPASEQELV